MYLTAQNILDLECIFQLCEVYLQPKNLQFALGEKKEAMVLLVVYQDSGPQSFFFGAFFLLCKEKCKVTL